MIAGDRGAERVVGIDGCRAGWVAVVLPGRRATRPGRAEVVVPAGFGVVTAAVDAGDWSLVGVDMPIGLPDDHARDCDRAARRLLGPRRSSVFPTPARAVLAAADYDDALRRSRAALGVGLSRQAWNLVPRIRELDAALHARHHERIVECHPELCFAGLAGAPLAEPKRTPAGRARRLALLEPHVPGIADLLDDRPSGVAADDLLDAAAVAVAMRALRRGRALVLDDGRTDARGRPMRIVGGPTWTPDR